MPRSKYMNPAQMVADTLSSMNYKNVSMYSKPGLSKEEREEVTKESLDLFNDVRDGNLDFITDALSAHIIILNNVVATCHKKSSGTAYFKEYTELSVKAVDQLRKSGLALAQIKNVIVNIENLTLQQNNLLQLNTGQITQASKTEVTNGKTMVTA